MTGQWKGHENPYLLTLVGPRTGRCWVQKPGQLVFTEHLLTSPLPPAGGRSYSPDFIHVETESERLSALSEVTQPEDGRTQLGFC